MKVDVQVSDRIPLTSPYSGGEGIKAIREVFESKLIVYDNEVAQFEKECTNRFNLEENGKELL
ncbi:MAG TPA: hypothetical protein EYP59_09620 [Thiotrichaceae bacterium]|nr:hypothetical protein [Thiotrichaceae bacterium]